MIPLRDSVRSTSYPYVTVSLVALNTIIFILQLSLGHRELALLFNTFGVVPASFSSGQFSTGFFPLLSLFTAIFLHGSLLHLGGNMLYLWVFGDNVEDRLGHWGFLLFYLIAGMLGNLAHILANPISATPTIGASGSIAGILGAYMVFYPRAKVQAFIPLIFIFTITRIRAVYFLFLWFVIQLLNGLTVTGAGAAVAWWAHIGGFVTGAVMGAVLRFWFPEKVFS